MKENKKENNNKESPVANNPGNNTVVQTKLTVSETDSLHEKEADAAADKVMQMPAQNFIQQKNANAGEGEKQVQLKGATPVTGTTVSDSLNSRLQSTNGSGDKMDKDTESFMNNRFGADFSNVKIHTGSEATQMNRELNAKAFTAGNDIYFNKGEYQPGSTEGQHLLAHELTHTLQQRGGESAVQRKTTAPTHVEGGGATPGKGAGIDVVFIIKSPDDAFTGDVIKYIQNTLEGQEYYLVNGLDELFKELDRIATGWEYHYVPFAPEIELPPEIERRSHLVQPGRKVRRIRLVAHGQTVIGGVKMQPPGGGEKVFIPPADIVTYSKQPHIQEIVKKAMTPDAQVEFWGCNIGDVPDAGQAWSNLFQSDFKATGHTFKTGFDEFYRRPDADEEGEDVEGLAGKVVRVKHSSEVESRNKELKASFNTWLLQRYVEFSKNGDILPIKGQNDQIAYMKSLFDKSGGDLKYIQIERNADQKLIRPGDATEWKKLWVEFKPVKIGTP